MNLGSSINFASNLNLSVTQILSIKLPTSQGYCKDERDLKILFRNYLRFGGLQPLKKAIDTVPQKTADTYKIFTSLIGGEGGCLTDCFKQFC